jgi:CspA family cold shock protein
MKGTVKWYNTKRGYGFIQGEDGEDIFVHKSDVPFWTIFLNKGDKVQYNTKKIKKGIKAENIKML